MKYALFTTAFLLFASVALQHEPLEQKPMGGPTAELRSLEYKERLFRNHFASLAEEEEKIVRERRAVRRALVSSQGKGRRRAQQRAVLAQRMHELTLKRAGIEESRAVLLALKRDNTQYEELLIASYRKPQPRLQKVQTVQLRPYSTPASFTLAWPLIPSEGLSAGFHDAGYQKRFGMPHDAIDIPAEQGSIVTASADGKVVAVNDRGFGYNTLVLKHDSGVETLYGHVSDFFVEEGDYVTAGNVIALSGGRPGSPGAGLLTTGPHLHFEVLLHGQAIDPLYYLAPMEVALDNANESVIPAM